jgi:hypothetical protein
MDIFLPVIVFGAAAGFALAFGAGRGCPVRWARLLHGAAALATLAALGRFLVQVAGWLPAGSTANSYDFQVFYAAAEAARAWAPLYDLAGIRRDPGEIVVYRHAPIGAVLFVPWTLLPYQVALNGWRLLNVAVYAATLWTFLRHFEIHWRSPLALALAAVWFASTPSRDSLALGQWDALFLSMFLTLLVALTTRRDRDLLGGAFLSLPITLKFFPVLLLLGPFVARRWRIFAGCLLGGVTLLIVGLLAGPQNTLVFVRDVAPVVGGGTLYAENQTLYAFVGRLLASELSGKGFGATYPVDLTRWLSRLLALPIVLVTALVADRADRLGTLRHARAPAARRAGGGAQSPDGAVVCPAALRAGRTDHPARLRARNLGRGQVIRRADPPAADLQGLRLAGALGGARPGCLAHQARALQWAGAAARLALVRAGERVVSRASRGCDRSGLVRRDHACGAGCSAISCHNSILLPSGS